MTKDNYIGTYIKKKMAKHNLPYGIAYLSLLGEIEAKAEKNWERYLKRLKPYKNVTIRSNSLNDNSEKVLKKYPLYQIDEKTSISGCITIGFKYHQHFCLKLKE